MKVEKLVNDFRSYDGGVFERAYLFYSFLFLEPFHLSLCSSNLDVYTVCTTH